VCRFQEEYNLSQYTSFTLCKLRSAILLNRFNDSISSIVADIITSTPTIGCDDVKKIKELVTSRTDVPQLFKFILNAKMLIETVTNVRSTSADVKESSKQLIGSIALAPVTIDTTVMDSASTATDSRAVANTIFTRFRKLETMPLHCVAIALIKQAMLDSRNKISSHERESFAKQIVKMVPESQPVLSFHVMIPLFDSGLPLEADYMQDIYTMFLGFAHQTNDNILVNKAFNIILTRLNAQYLQNKACGMKNLAIYARDKLKSHELAIRCARIMLEWADKDEISAHEAKDATAVIMSCAPHVPAELTKIISGQQCVFSVVCNCFAMCCGHFEWK
jgi:hypothetical protein